MIEPLATGLTHRYSAYSRKVPSQLTGIKGEDDVAAADDDTGRDLLCPFGRQGEGFIEDGARLSPGCFHRKSGEQFSGERVLRQTAGVASRVNEENTQAIPACGRTPTDHAESV